MNVQERVLNEKIDPLLTVDILSEIASQALETDADVVHTEILLGGCWNRVIAVEVKGESQDLVFKISPHVGDKGIRREYEVLSEFTRLSTMPVPRPLLLDDSGDRIPGTILVMARIPGVVLHQASNHLTPQHWRNITEQLVDVVCNLHTNRGATFGGVELDDDQRHQTWAGFWLPRFDRVMTEVAESNHVDSSFIAEIEELRPRFSEILDPVTESTLTHYDIWSGNVMIDVVDGRPILSGFVDVQGHWADYARELSFMEMFGLADQSMYMGYRRQHSLDDGLDLRKNLYNLKMHLKHITMYPDQSYYRNGARTCFETVRYALQ